MRFVRGHPTWSDARREAALREQQNHARTRGEIDPEVEDLAQRLYAEHEAWRREDGAAWRPRWTTIDDEAREPYWAAARILLDGEENDG